MYFPGWGLVVVFQETLDLLELMFINQAPVTVVSGPGARQHLTWSLFCMMLGKGPWRHILLDRLSASELYRAQFWVTPETDRILRQLRDSGGSFGL